MSESTDKPKFAPAPGKFLLGSPEFLAINPFVKTVIPENFVHYDEHGQPRKKKSPTTTPAEPIPSEPINTQNTALEITAEILTKFPDHTFKLKPVPNKVNWH